jgi:predicted RNA binding protein YcfA (HicA-like mRNA interferase family)
MKNRQLKAILRRRGFAYTRSRGDHHMYTRAGQRPIVLFGDDGTEAPEWQARRVQGQNRKKKGKYDNC